MAKYSFACLARIVFTQRQRMKDLLRGLTLSSQNLKHENVYVVIVGRLGQKFHQIEGSWLRQNQKCIKSRYLSGANSVTKAKSFKKFRLSTKPHLLIIFVPYILYNFGVTARAIGRPYSTQYVSNLNFIIREDGSNFV